MSEGFSLSLAHGLAPQGRLLAGGRFHHGGDGVHALLPQPDRQYPQAAGRNLQRYHRDRQHPLRGQNRPGSFRQHVGRRCSRAAISGSLYGSASFVIRTFPKDILEESAGEGASEQQKLIAFQNLLASFEEEDSGGVSGSMKACSSFSAEDELVRIREDIRWALEGYDESCLEGSERVCILSDEFGYQPGDTVPFLASFSLPEELSDMRGIFRMKVAATYHGKITDFKAVMPIATYEQLCSTATQAHQQLGTGMEWPFDLSSFLFTVKDNYQLEELKGYLTEQGLAGTSGIRAVIDDRILRGTVAPVESNLSLLEGLYAFFFGMVTAIGFLLSFLLARGRKPEYAVMRMLGESRLQITLKALLEQFVLCLGGVLLGAAAVGIIGQEGFRPGVCAAILLCYTVGAAVAVLLTVRVNVMDILRDKE